MVWTKKNELIVTHIFVDEKCALTTKSPIMYLT